MNAYNNITNNQNEYNEDMIHCAVYLEDYNDCDEETFPLFITIEDEETLNEEE